MTEEITIDKIVRLSELREAAELLTSGKVKVALLVWTDEDGILRLGVAGGDITTASAIGQLEIAKTILIDECFNEGE